MSASIEFAVTTHVSRAEMVAKLVAELKIPGLKLYTDSVGTCAWENAKRALVGRESGSTHLVIIQDDVWPVKHLREAIERIVAAVPDNPVSLYSSSTAPVFRDAYERADRYLIMRGFAFGQCNILPVKYLNDLLAFESAVFLPPTRPNISLNDDVHYAAFFGAMDIDFYCTVPSLVEHIGNKQSVQWLDRRNWTSRSMASVFVPDLDPLKLDWSVHFPPKKVGNFRSWIRMNAVELTPEGKKYFHL